MMAARALLTRSPGAPPVTCWWLGRSTHPHAERGGGTAAGIALARRARAAAGGGAGGGWRQHRRLRRRRAICGCWGGIVSSAATAPWRPTLRVCSVASRRTLWSPTRPTALITTRLGHLGGHGALLRRRLDDIDVADRGRARSRVRDPQNPSVRRCVGANFRLCAGGRLPRLCLRCGPDGAQSRAGARPARACPRAFPLGA